MEEPGIAFLKNCCAAVAQYAGERRRVIAPMDGNTWQTHRLTLLSDGSPPFFLEHVTPLWWRRCFESAGFRLCSEYSSSIVSIAEKTRNANRIRRLEERLLGQKNIVVRPISLASFHRDLVAIHKLSVESFASNFLYTSICLDEFLRLYQPIKKLIEPEYVLLAEHGRELVGFVFAYPDFAAQREERTISLIVKTLAVKPGAAYSGLGTYLVDRVEQQALQNGLTSSIHALKHEANQSQRISKRFGAREFRKYGLMTIYL